MSGTKYHAGSGTCTSEELSKMEVWVYYYFICFKGRRCSWWYSDSAVVSFREAHVPSSFKAVEKLRFPLETSSSDVEYKVSVRTLSTVLTSFFPHWLCGWVLEVMLGFKEPELTITDSYCVILLLACNRLPLFHCKFMFISDCSKAAYFLAAIHNSPVSLNLLILESLNYKKRKT